MKSKIRKAQLDYEEHLLAKLHSNPKAFYSYVKSKQKVKHFIPHLQRSDGQIADSDHENAEILASFFESTFTTEDTSFIPDFPQKSDSILSNIDISTDLVFSKLSSLKSYKSPGPDNINSYILKACACNLSVPLSLLFNQSFESGILPKDWKCANITPVFKKGCKSDASNYRPISLTSQVVKILESIISDSIYCHMIRENLFNYHQHGFIQGKSCFTNLLESFQDWIHAIDQGYAVDIVYLDYKKAFDSVPHQRLLYT